MEIGLVGASWEGFVIETAYQRSMDTLFYRLEAGAEIDPLLTALGSRISPSR